MLPTRLCKWNKKCPPGQLSWAKLLRAGTEPKDTKKAWTQLCLQQGLGQPFVQDLLCRLCDIEYSCAEPALPLCCCPRVPGKELTQHPGVLAQPSFPQESSGQVRPALLQGTGLMEAALAARSVHQGSACWWPSLGALGTKPLSHLQPFTLPALAWRPQSLYRKLL